MAATSSPSQFVGIAVFTFLVVDFYIFQGPYLGNQILDITLLSLFSFMAVSVAFLYISCTATDPSDNTSVKRNKKNPKSGNKLPKLNYKQIFGHVVVRFFRRIENKLLKEAHKEKLLGRMELQSANGTSVAITTCGHN